MNRWSHPYRRQRGVAIITALVVVAAATVAIAGMMWRQSVAVRKLENQNALDQARWLARSAIEWSRLILLQDARTSSVDHEGEIWAIPLAETRVTDALTGGPTNNGDGFKSIPGDHDQEADATLSGRIIDAQSYFNLANLLLSIGPVPVSAPPTGTSAQKEISVTDPINLQALAELQRLLVIVGQSETAAEMIALRMTQTPRPLDFDALATELTRGQRADAEVFAALRPYVVLLPKPTPVNFNTAPPEVMAAILASLSLTQARALAQSRDRLYFNQVSDVFARLPKSDAATANANADVAVSTHYFEVSGQVRYGRAEYALAALIERDNSGLTHVVSLKE